MAYRTFGALVASIGVAAMMLFSATETFARSGGAARGGAFAGPHPAFRHHGGRVPGGFFPGGYFGGSYYPGEPVAQAAPVIPNDIRYTYTYDVPWDWAHRYPPNVVPSDRPYVSSCPTESVTVPGRGGDRTVNITRCY